MVSVSEAGFPKSAFWKEAWIVLGAIVYGFAVIVNFTNGVTWHVHPVLLSVGWNVINSFATFVFVLFSGSITLRQLDFKLWLSMSVFMFMATLLFWLGSYINYRLESIVES